MATIFGNDLTAKMFVPDSTASWEVKDLLKKDDYSNVILLSFSSNDQEIIDIRRCFDETTHIFSFGRHTQANVFDVSFLIFLFSKCKNQDSGGKGKKKKKKSGGKWLELKDLKEKYDKNRIYKNPAPIEITIGSMTVNGYLIKMSIGDVNPATKACAVSFTFILDQEV